MELASITLVLTFEDATGSKASCSLHLKDGTTVAEADAALPGLASAFASISTAALVGVRYVYKVIQVPKPVATGLQPIIHTGVFIFETITDGRAGLVELPSIKVNFIDSSGPCAGHCINLSGSEVIAFLDELAAAGSTNPFADVLTDVSAAYIQSRV